MTLTNAEIVFDQGVPREGVFDLNGSQAQAVSDALAYYRRTRYASHELDTDTVLALRELTLLNDQFATGEFAAHMVARTTHVQTRLLHSAVTLYLAERDVESYQSPEERVRLAVLAELSEPLRDLMMRLNPENALTLNV